MHSISSCILLGIEPMTVVLHAWSTAWPSCISPFWVLNTSHYGSKVDFERRCMLTFYRCMDHKADVSQIWRFSLVWCQTVMRACFTRSVLRFRCSAGVSFVRLTRLIPNINNQGADDRRPLEATVTKWSFISGDGGQTDDEVWYWQRRAAVALEIQPFRKCFLYALLAQQTLNMLLFVFSISEISIPNYFPLFWSDLI